MITVNSGKLTIPEDERFIGFIGDDQGLQIELLLKHFFVPRSTYALCLRFDDGSVRIVELTGCQIGSDVLLTWNVSREHLYRKGVVTAQLRINSGDGRVIHSTRDFFFVGGSVDSDDGGEESYVTTALLEEKLNGVRACLPYTDENGAFIVTPDGDVRIAKAAEVYTKSEINGMIGDLETILSTV